MPRGQPLISKDPADFVYALETANKTGARFALILGDTEIAAGTYLIKDMASGEQTALTREAVAAHVRKN